MENFKIIAVENENQLARCLSVRREVFVNEQQVPEELEVDDYDRLDSTAKHVVVEGSNGDAAAARFIPYKDGAAKMQRVAVRSAYRGQGLGRVLMSGLEDAARQAGYSRCILDSQCHAEGFYRSLGYRTLPGEPFYDAGILHVRMEKELQ
ncbi:GNAT family N-acetyltransferase [Saccharibacillus sacchari]|uniref:GNAT family N-acetyltransferase n=1 Tax=Saccharibacillus sacchari TaxID=456493 RepID=A0ACC6PBM8_9BACL